MKRRCSNLKATRRGGCIPLSKVQKAETQIVKHMLRAAVFALGASFLDNDLMRHKCGQLSLPHLAARNVKIHQWVAYSCKVIKEFTPSMQSFPEITVRFQDGVKGSLEHLKN